MRRYWIENKFLTPSEAVLQGDLYHHIFDVCRQDVGSQFELINEDGYALFVEVISRKKNSALASIREKRKIKPPKLPLITLCLSVPRFPVFESLLEKLVELGVHKVRLFFSEHSFVKNESKISPEKMERWQRIVISSTQQTGRGDLLKIERPISFAELMKTVNQNSQDLCLFAYEGGSEPEMQSLTLKNALSQRNPQPVENIQIIVGSEGGFSTEEARWMISLGHRPVHLGEQILRVETACTALVSVLKYESNLFE